MTDFARALASAMEAAGDGPVMVHSGLFRARKAIDPSTEPPERQAAHLRVLKQVVGGRTLWFPAFNYDFCRTGEYRPAKDPVQVGVLPEYVRLQPGAWRVGPPVFNFCGGGEPPPFVPTACMDPFGDDSLFARLDREGGSILLYGAGAESLTAMHYIEHRCGRPVYRYDKEFHGRVIAEDGTAGPTTLLYHVWPLGVAWDYDWERIMGDGMQEGHVVEVAPGATLIHLPGLVALWTAKTAEDPLYLLNPGSRAEAEKHLQRLGRRFRQSDFEDHP